MHKLESFALSCNSKIGKPFIEKCFYPIVSKKYICISKEHEFSSESYDYFDDVIFHIKPFLDKNNIDIIEIGKSKSKPTFYSKNYSHVTPNQANYILSKSLLYFGNNNYYLHTASALDKKTVCPSKLDYVETWKPYWSNEGCTVILPDVANETKPLFSNEENPKTINTILPEVLAKSILDSLGIENDMDTIETIYTGETYNDLSGVVDFLPGPYDPGSIKIQDSICVRLDKEHDLNFLLKCAPFSKITISTNKTISPQILNHLKDKIVLLNLFVDKKTTLEDIKNLESIGKPLNLFCKDSKNIQSIRLKFIDYNIYEYGKKSKKDLNVKAFSDLTFLSKKNIIQQAKVFNSYLSCKEMSNTSTVKDDPSFWEDLPYFRIFRKKA